MNGDAETLLARHRHNFAVHEEFLIAKGWTAVTPRSSASNSLAEQHSETGQSSEIKRSAPERERRHDMPDKNATSHRGVRPSQDFCENELRREATDRRSCSARNPGRGAIEARSIDLKSLERSRVTRDPRPCTELLPEFRPTLLNTVTTTPPRYATAKDDADDVDHLVQQRLRASGRYHTTSSPDAMYVKSQAWALRRNQINEALRREQMAAALRDCTFTPRLSSPRPPSVQHIHETLEQAAPKGMGAPGTAGGLTPTRVEDMDVRQHTARLEEARRRRAAAEVRRSGRYTAHPWTGKPTIPREFELGLRVAEQIPALRKPYMPSRAAGRSSCSPYRSDYDDDVEVMGIEEVGVLGAPSGRAQAQRSPRCNTAPPPHLEEEEDKTGEPPSCPTSQTASLSSQQHQQHHLLHPGDFSLALTPVSKLSEPTLAPLSDGGSIQGHEGITDVNKKISEAASSAHNDDLLRRLTDQLAYKDSVIRSQSLHLERLHRELETVKEELHYIASLGYTAQ